MASQLYVEREDHVLLLTLRTERLKFCTSRCYSLRVRVRRRAQIHLGRPACRVGPLEPESAARTRLTLTHARFTQDETRDEHERNWADSLEKLREELCAA